MPLYCAACGNVVNIEHKFCPECGAKIIISKKEDGNRGSGSYPRELHSEKFENIIICDSCGDENSAENEACITCGAKLSGTSTKRVSKEPKETTVIVDREFTQKSSKVPSKHKVKRTKQTRQDVTGVAREKEFDPKKLYIIVAVIAIFAFIILASSGVFDSEVSVTNTGFNQPNNSGIDLTSIQRINELEAKLNANPDDTATLLELAHLQNDSGFYEKAIPLYQRYLNKIPSNADVRIDMGVCYYNLGNYETAIKEMKNALEYKPDHQIGHLNLGIVNLTAGNIEEAKKWLQKAIDLGPDNDIGKKAKELLNSHNL